MSSPSDLLYERTEIKSEIERFSRNHEATGIIFKVIDSEEVPSSFGNDPQQILDDAFDQFDIYIGLMRSKFGSPTTKHASGTEGEFRTALSRLEKGECSDVSFYFLKPDLNKMSDAEIAAYMKVVQFRGKLIEERCGYFREIESTQKLIDFISKTLTNVIEKK